MKMNSVHRKKPGINLENLTKYNNSNKMSKIFLKPIEIKDPRKNPRISNKNENLEQSPNIRVSIEKNFAKTSNINFKNFELDNNINQEEITRLEEMYNIPIGQIRKIFKQAEHFKPDDPRLDEMITLCHLNSLDNSSKIGNIKKMLHIPTLKIYIVRVCILLIKL
jgi:hypothetical protein